MLDIPDHFIAARYHQLKPYLTERARRLWAAVEAEQLGYGGVSRVARATGITRVTITAGIAELESGTSTTDPERSRNAGGGRKKLDEMLGALENAMGIDKGSALLWTSQSTKALAATLSAQGHSVSDRSVAKTLLEAGYQVESKRPGDPRARETHFDFSRRLTEQFLSRKLPVVCVQARKTLGKPLTVDSQTKALAFECLWHWWAATNPPATEVLLHLDVRGLRKPWIGWQALANTMGVTLLINAFPPGISKWAQIDGTAQQLFTLTEPDSVRHEITLLHVGAPKKMKKVATVTSQELERWTQTFTP